MIGGIFDESRLHEESRTTQNLNVHVLVEETTGIEPSPGKIVLADERNNRVIVHLGDHATWNRLLGALIQSEPKGDDENGNGKN